MQYKMNQNTIPPYANTENNQIPAQYMNNMGNYGNVTNMMDINNTKLNNQKYNAPISSHIQNKGMEMMKNNMGIQFTNTPKKSNNSYGNMNLGIENNQIYRYQNSKNI